MNDRPQIDPGFLGKFRDDFPSLCTIRTETQTQNPDGQAVGGAPADVAGLVNIPCRKMPAYLAGTRSATAEERAAYTMDRNLYELDLFGYYPQIGPSMLVGGVMQPAFAVVDGVTHKIIGPLGDGSKVKTDLKIELLTQ